LTLFCTGEFAVGYRALLLGADEERAMSARGCGSAAVVLRVTLAQGSIHGAKIVS
jgi:hypothetical protein